MGIQTPIIQRNQGNTRSATHRPFQVACSKNQYIPPPSFTKIMIAKLYSKINFHYSDDDKTLAICYSVKIPDNCCNVAFNWKTQYLNRKGEKEKKNYLTLNIILVKCKFILVPDPPKCIQRSKSRFPNNSCVLSPAQPSFHLKMDGHFVLIKLDY